MFKNLMLVDDDEDDQGFFLEVIQDHYPGVVCVTAGNGQEALNKLVGASLLPDIIFLDLNMPLMNGKQFLVEIKKHEGLKRIPIVILTTSSDQETITETARLGAKDFITKPDKISSWKAILKRIIDNPALRQ
jgi:CheY-like chemotaxis protein